jgi:SpoVK/Ycf46/Vps4 family AAA+-type ATPase
MVKRNLINNVTDNPNKIVKTTNIIISSVNESVCINPIKMIYINKNINSIDDLINIAENYKPNHNYNINVKKLWLILPALYKLQNIIGMDNVKKSIINQIIYFIQDFQDKNTDMLHTIIQGSPGVGKTLLGEIIGLIYHSLNIIQHPPSKKQRLTCSDDDYTLSSSNKEFKFIIAKRSDLIGKYLGHTAAKTQDVINQSLGGVLFIDEAYSLGNPEGRDSFSKECIDTINQNLTEKKNQLLVIIAGYKDALDKCFFSYNEGLRRRFPFVYTIDKYSNEDLSKIFVKMIKDIGIGWSLSNNISMDSLHKIFKDNYDCFEHSAGDVETLTFNLKIEHAKRVFCYPPNSELRKKISIEDIKNSIENFKINKCKKDEELPDFVKSLYT